jgi:hypothetical protein
LGFYTLDCADLDEAVAFARELSEVNPSGGSYEIRPVSLFSPVKGEAVVIDGPFAETKEQFLGFYTLDCANLDEAVEFARELSEVNPSGGSYEIRPVSVFNRVKAAFG